MSENHPTAVDSSIVAELFVGELASWPIGLCEITGEREVLKGHYEPIMAEREEPDRLVAYGENGHAIAVVNLPAELEEATEKLNKAVVSEYSAL